MKILIYYIIVALESLAANLAHPITPTLIQNLNLPDYMFGLMFAGMSITNFLFSPFWGKLADYLQSRSILLIGCIGYGLGQLFFWQATTPFTIMIARCFSGFFVGGISVAMLTYLVNTSAAEDRNRNLTIHATTVTVASTFGYLIGGLAGELSLDIAFGLQVALLFACGLLFALLCRKDRRQNNSRPSVSQIAKGANPFSAFIAGRQFMTPLFAILFGVVLLSMFASTAYDQCFNYYIKDQFGFSSAYNGTIKAVIGVISLVSNMTLCLYIVRKTNVARSNVLLLLFGGISMLGVLIFESVLPFILFTILYFGINAISVPVLQSLVSGRASSQNSNLVMGFYNAIKSLGMVAGSLIAGFVYDYNPKFPFMLAAISFAGAFLLALGYWKKIKK